MTVRIEMDVSEVRSLSRHLANNVKRLEPQLEELLDRHANATAVVARELAPKDRPWLGTEEGIRVEKREPLTRTIISPRDPEGQSVGYRVEYGTADTAPQPFMGPAIKSGSTGFQRDALELLVRTTL